MAKKISSLISTKTLIVIPVFNGEKFIARSLNSCLNQTKLTQIWVVDNCSIDKTLDIVKEYQKKSGNIKIFFNKINLGRVGNWNRCLDLFINSSYKYIKFLFVGDELFPQCIEESEKIMESDSGIGALAFGYEFVREDGSITISKQDYKENKMFSPKEITKLNLGHGGLLGAIVCNVYSKKAIQKNRFTPYFTIKTDFDTKILAHNKAYYLDKVLAKFNLDCHQTFDKAFSTWGFLEFTYSEALMLEQFKGMFSQAEYTDLRQRIVLNGIRHQLPLFNFTFILNILRLLSSFVLEAYTKPVQYFLNYYWNKLKHLS